MRSWKWARLLLTGLIAASALWTQSAFADETEEGGNNLAVPAIFAEGVGIGGATIAGDVANTGVRTCIDDVNGDWGTPVSSLTLPDNTVFPLDGPYFLNGLEVTDPGGACWQADWVDGASAAAAQVDRADWGDNLVRVAYSDSQGPIRVEMTLYQDAPVDDSGVPLTGYTAVKLYPPPSEDHEESAIQQAGPGGPDDGGQGGPGGPGDGGQGPGGPGEPGGGGEGGPPTDVGGGRPFEVYGTASVGGAGVRADATAATVYSSEAHLSIHRLNWALDPDSSPSGEIPDTLSSGFSQWVSQTITDGGLGSEVNQAGKVIFGYNWFDVPGPGWYRVTFSLDSGANAEILGLDPGDLVSDESEGGSDEGKAAYHPPTLATAPGGTTYTYVDVFVLGDLTTGTISGSVSDSDDQALDGIQVEVYDLTGTKVAVLTTGNGSFSGSLTEGSYKIKFVDPAGDYASEWYDDEVDINSADIVSVETAPLITATLDRLSTADRPNAVNDAAFVPINSTGTTINVLANDSDPEGDTLTISAVDTTATQGTVAISTGSLNVVYTPPTDFEGVDTFTYTVTDGNGGFDTATVTVSVTSLPAPPPGGGGISPIPPQDLGTVSVDETLNPSTDAVVIDGVPTLLVTNSDGSVSIAIPVAALPGSGNVRVLVEPVDLDDALAGPEQALLSVGDQAFRIQILNATGVEITQFQADISISVQIDPTTVDLSRVQVMFFDTLAGWTKVPTSVDADGTVTFTTEHFSVYAIFELPSATGTLKGGLNYITFAGANGTQVQQWAGQFFPHVVSINRFNVQTQAWERYTPGAPDSVQTLRRLQNREALAIRLAPGSEVSFTQTALVPSASGLRSQGLNPGLNPLTVTTPNAVTPLQFMYSLGDAVTQMSRFNRGTQTWQTWIPNGPAFANTLANINPNDVVWVRVANRYGPVSIDFMEVPGQGNATAALLNASDTVALTVRDRDRTRLRDLSCDGDANCPGGGGGGDQVQARDRDRDRLATCVPAGAGYYLLGRTITVAPDGQTATVRVRLGIHAGTGDGQVIEQTWQFQHTEADAWRLVNVPDCPFS